MRGFVFAALSLLLLAGCASQTRPSEIGSIGVNTRYEKELAAELEARNYYDGHTPKIGAYIRSNPPGAVVEWYNDDGIWVHVGNTPTKDIVIEGTGKPELFRVSAPGYLPKIEWVAATRNSSSVEVEFELQPELPTDRYLTGRHSGR